MNLRLQLRDLVNRKLLRRHRDIWNHRHALGKWSSMGDLQELARFSVIAGYVQHLKPGGRILELGAGEGHLQRRFDRSRYSLYYATDVSDLAIARGRRFEDEKTRYLVADLNTYVPDTDFDCIVINEAIYYGRSVQAVLDRLAPFLRPGGIFVICINGDARNAPWHDMLDRCSFPLLDRTVVKCTRNVFQISVLGRPEDGTMPVPDGPSS